MPPVFILKGTLVEAYTRESGDFLDQTKLRGERDHDRMAYRFAPLAGIAIAIAASALLLGVSALADETNNPNTAVSRALNN